MEKYSLIIAIVNTGFTDLVMDAARESGAPGGTVLHGRLKKLKRCMALQFLKVKK